MKILITGGGGFIGSHLVEYFQGKAEVRVLDNFRSGRKSNLNGFDVELLEGSVEDTDMVKQAMQGVDYVFHLAAMVSVPESMDNPAECVRINTIGLLNVLRQAADSGVKKLCFSSSCAVYGNNPILPKHEDMLPEPLSPYSVTKLDGEFYCKMFSYNGWLNTTCLRYFNVFGPRQDPKSQYAAAIPIFLTKALNNEPIIIFDDGLQTRDFVYVKDVALANVFFAQSENLHGVYNVAYGQSITINALAEKIIQLTGSTSTIVHKEARAGEVKHSQADIGKLNRVGYEFSHKFDEGLKNTISSLKKDNR